MIAYIARADRMCRRTRTEDPLVRFYATNVPSLRQQALSRRMNHARAQGRDAFHFAVHPRMMMVQCSRRPLEALHHRPPAAEQHVSQGPHGHPRHHSASRTRHAHQPPRRLQLRSNRVRRELCGTPGRLLRVWRSVRVGEAELPESSHLHHKGQTNAAAALSAVVS